MALVSGQSFLGLYECIAEDTQQAWFDLLESVHHIREVFVVFLIDEDSNESSGLPIRLTDEISAVQDDFTLGLRLCVHSYDFLLRFSAPQTNRAMSSEIA